MSPGQSGMPGLGLPPRRAWLRRPQHPEQAARTAIKDPQPRDRTGAADH